uniref:Uncharacterized protein n=1 Tax=Arundo donax TaxID=35708 RepID=A0A0A9ARP0_ARUDO
MLLYMCQDPVTVYVIGSRCLLSFEGHVQGLTSSSATYNLLWVIPQWIPCATG